MISALICSCAGRAPAVQLQDDLLVEFKSTASDYAVAAKVNLIPFSQMASLSLFHRLYGQVTQEKMPEKATESVERQVEELRKVTAKKLILLVLDGRLFVIPKSMHWFLASHSFAACSLAFPHIIRHVGLRARTTFLMHRSCNCLEAFVHY